MHSVHLFITYGLVLLFCVLILNLSARSAELHDPRETGHPLPLMNCRVQPNP